MHFFLSALLLFVAASLRAQNFSIVYDNPDQLAVCFADTMQITVQNNTAGPVSAAVLDLELPAGLEYVPGSLSAGTENDLSNLQSVELGLPPLAPGVPVNIRVQLRAACSIIDAINNSTLFTASLRVRSGAISEQTTTTAFPVETGLLVITQIDNDSLAGEKGQMLSRTIHIRNTRLGIIRNLTLLDTHDDGISIDAPGAALEVDQQFSFSAQFDGTFFTAFGDGDTLLEFGETVLVTEKISIEECGIPNSFFINSNISVGWSCDFTQPDCQADSSSAKVLVLPFTNLPDLKISGAYQYPQNRCALEPTQQRLHVKNVGSAPAKNVFVQLKSENPDLLGIDSASVKLEINGVAQSIIPALSTPHPFDSCGVTYHSALTVIIPEVPGGSTMDILFDTYLCSSPCEQLYPAILGNYFHLKECPEGGSVADTFLLAGLGQLTLANDIEVGECLAQDATYNLRYNVVSSRLFNNDGYLTLILDLPWGLFYTQQCNAVNTEIPESVQIDTLVTFDTITRVAIRYALPLNTDSLAFNFCVKNLCPPDGTYTSLPDQTQPDGGGTFYIYDDECSSCSYRIQAKALITATPDYDLTCDMSACDELELRALCDCGDNDDDVIIGTPGGMFGDCMQCVGNYYEMTSHFNAYRLNLGLADHDDDRKADPGAIDTALVRRDRFWPGDTMRVNISSKISSGDSVCSIAYGLYVETVRSDIGHAGNPDSFNILEARNYLANPERFRRIRSKFSIWRNGHPVVFDCPVDPTMWTEKALLYGIVTEVNTDPPEPIDELVSMGHILNFDVNRLIDAGCLPPCFALSGGDSITVEVDFKLDFNFTPISTPNSPPLINFELGFQDRSATFYNYRQGDTLMFQYTGFRDTLDAATFGIRACTTSTQVTPFQYGMRIARPNLFPYEVRPMASINDYTLFLPGGVVPSTATLKFLELQQGLSVFSDVAIPFSLQNSLLDLDFDPFFAAPLDEGFLLETKLDFEANCRFNLPDSSAQQVVLDYADCLKMPDPDTIVWENKIGFFSNVARDTITTASTVIDLTSDTAEAIIMVKNLAPVTAPNYYMYIVNPGGGLTDIELLQLPQLIPIPQTNGVFQLGTLGILAQKSLLVRAKNTSCDPQVLRLVYGWDCAPVQQPGVDACAIDSLSILFRPQQPELELDLMQLPLQLPLCDTSEYISFEIFNADLGYAYSPVTGIELPQGISILPGSCQVSYPEGAAFTNIPDPVFKGGLLYEWELASIIPAVSDNGLPGVNADDLNGIDIRFKVLTQCGVVSNTQFVFSARALKFCGDNTNTLRKASNPLIIDGLLPSYSTQLGISEAGGSGGPVFCEEQRTLSISVQMSGPAAEGDSVYIHLPEGYSYVAGSYQPGPNAPAGPPQALGQVLSLPLPIGLPPNSIIQFNIGIITAALPTCAEAVILVNTLEKSVAYCPLIDDDCDVYIASGAALYSFIPVNPAINILGASAGVTSEGKGAYNITLQNAGNTTVAPSVVQIYRDVDADGQLSAADTLLYVAPVNTSIDPNDVYTLLDEQAPNPISLCNLLAVLPAAENCDCETVVYPFSGGTLFYAAQILCAGDSASIGIDPETGHSYQWNGIPAGGCDTCSQFEYLPDLGAFQYVLLDQITGCNVSHIFELEVFAPPVATLSNQSVCRGEPVVLQAGDAAAWHWSGPGIIDSTTQTQTILVNQDAVYSVTITSAQGCTDDASATVTVLPIDSVDLGATYTCVGDLIEVPGGTLTDVPGSYCFTYINQSGCDSVVCILLQVVANSAEEVLHCPGDTIFIFGEPVTAAGEYCKEFPSTKGCDSTHCITVIDLPEVSIPGLDTVNIVVALGDTVQLEAPTGFAGYEWTPPTGLSCIFCPDPLLVVQDSAMYTLILTNNDGCEGELYYRMAPFPPCDPYRLNIPNAISPNGDGNNDVFRVVPYEGAETVSRLTIFNRWGEKIFEKSGANTFWDGTIKGEPAASDVYIWLIEVECTGERQMRHGNVTVIR